MFVVQSELLPAKGFLIQFAPLSTLKARVAQSYPNDMIPGPVEFHRSFEPKLFEHDICILLWLIHGRKRTQVRIPIRRDSLWIDLWLQLYYEHGTQKGTDPHS